MKIVSNKSFLYLLRISIFLLIIATSFYLKYKYFLSSVDFNNMNIYISDNTNFILEFNQFSNILITSSLALFLLYFTHYRICISSLKSTYLDNFFAIYFSINLLLLFITRFSISNLNNGDLCQLSILLSSLTFLQVDFIDLLPIGIILYIPLFYSFFLKKRD